MCTCVAAREHEEHRIWARLEPDGPEWKSIQSQHSSASPGCHPLVSQPTSFSLALCSSVAFFLLFSLFSSCCSGSSSFFLVASLAARAVSRPNADYTPLSHNGSQDPTPLSDRPLGCLLILGLLNLPVKRRERVSTTVYVRVVRQLVVRTCAEFFNRPERESIVPLGHPIPATGPPLFGLSPSPSHCSASLSRSKQSDL